METSFCITLSVPKKEAEEFEQDLKYVLKTNNITVNHFDEDFTVKIEEDDLSYKDLLSIVYLIKEYNYNRNVKDFEFNRW